MSELLEKMAKELITGNEAQVKYLTQEFIDKIGADAYGANATSASENAKALVD